MKFIHTQSLPTLKVVAWWLSYRVATSHVRGPGFDPVHGNQTSDRQGLNRVYTHV